MQLNFKKNITSRPLLVIAVTSHISMDFFQGQIEYLQKAGFDVAVVCSPGWKNQVADVKYYPVRMTRVITPFKDLTSLFCLITLFLRIKPNIINVGTPKAALLGGIAARLTNVPVRIYTCHGLRLETITGWKRYLLVAAEILTAHCVRRVVCVSRSLKKKYTALHLAPERKVLVIGDGSCNGIDLKKYVAGRRYISNEDLVDICRNEDDVFIGFVGRLNKDKGINELITAFEILKSKHPRLYLLLVGDFEQDDPVSQSVYKKIIEDERIINVGFVEDTLPYYKMMSILVLPTYREGLPTVLLEAGAMKIPVVATQATGCEDVVVNGQTGLLVPIGDIHALADAINSLLIDADLRMVMGRNARRRIKQLYSQEIVWKNMADFYREMLDECTR